LPQYVFIFAWLATS